MGMIIVLVFGWPAVFGSLALAAYGIIKDKFLWLIGAVILFLPFTFYLHGTPRFRTVAFFLPLFYVGAAVALKLKSKLLAILCLVPLTGFILWLGLDIRQ